MTSKVVQFGTEEEIGAHLVDEEENHHESANERLRHEPIFVPPTISGPTDLDKLMSTIFIAILKKCEESLTILREIHALPFIDVNLDYITSNEKFACMEYDEEIRVHPDYLFLVYRKLQRDISFLEKSLNVTIKNLQLNGTYGALLSLIRNYFLTIEDENTLLGLRKFNRNEVRKLRLFQEAERSKLCAEIQELTQQVGNVKDELNDGIAEYDTTIRFLRHYEATRNEQNRMILENKQNHLSSIKNRMTIDIERENRIHEELVQYIEVSQEEYEQNIEDWSIRYDADMEKWDQDVHYMKIKIEEQRESYEKLMVEFEQRHQEMEDYKEHKMQLQREAAELARRTKAAIKIQTWWRNIMLIKGLGPFRKKKGKGKKGSKNSAKKSK